MKANTAAMIRKIRKGASIKFLDAPLAGADLSGAKIFNCGLLSADLSQANLRGAHFFHTDLQLANLSGANLEGAIFEMVDATGGNFAEVKASSATFEFVRLLDAKFQNASLPKATFRYCDMSSANFSSCELGHAALIASNCTHAIFNDAMLEKTKTLDSRFHSAEFIGAQSFSRSHEIVSEILLRENIDDFETLKTVASILADRKRCYTDWRKYLADHLEEKAFALKIFKKYPESGCMEALNNEE